MRTIMIIGAIIMGAIGLFLAFGYNGTQAPGNDADAPHIADGAQDNAAQKAFRQANAQMHSGMNHIDKDADIAFIQGMIPHHQGAVDMANIVLKYGDDEEAKTLARTIIKAQEEEIAWMRSWLEKRGLKEVSAQTTADQPIDHKAMGH